MTNKEISLAIIEACKKSTELNDYCTLKFNQSITYMRGIELERDEWSDNEYEYLPMIIIDSVQRTSGINDNATASVLSVQVKIKHDEEYWKMEPIDNVITYDGIDEVEMVNSMITRAVEASTVLKCLDMIDIDSYADPVRFASNSTEYNGYIQFTFEKPTLIGCN